MSNEISKLAEKRRSIYSLGRTEVLPEKEIIKLVEHSVKYCPSAFNSQSARVVILFGEESQKLWRIVMETLRHIVPADKFAPTEAKINSFAAGYGTLLFFEENKTVTELQEKFPSYADRFPLWSEQSSGMLQYLIWLSLADKEVGASLQHYNPLIDDEVKSTWQLPDSWRLISQMPFGSIMAPAEDKTFLPLPERVKVFS